jgi:hypothetical protein
MLLRDKGPSSGGTLARSRNTRIVRAVNAKCPAKMIRNLVRKLYRHDLCEGLEVVRRFALGANSVAGNWEQIPVARTAGHKINAEGVTCFVCRGI